MKDALSGTLLAAVIFSFPAWSHSVSYFATDLGAVTASGINNSGDVVGTRSASLWSAKSTATARRSSRGRIVVR